MSDKSLFYKGFDESTDIDAFFDKLREYAEENDTGNPVYVLNRPLSDKEDQAPYTYEKALVLLVPKHKLLFLNYGKSPEAFENYVTDFLEDASALSKKYGYMKILGRLRNWENEFVEKREYSEIADLEIVDLLNMIKLSSKENERKGEFLISLLTGSINDIDKTGLEYPDTILEKIKRKIILFDGDQTRFIYDEPNEKRIVIQGLAGTGKTELLLHKIKEIYTKNENVKIVFTCHNKILAENLRTRIPDFFNFMKVDEQIKWEEKLWVMSSWGPLGNKNSGVYSYICDHYHIPFERFSYNTTFDGICKRALKNLRECENFDYCFDYILIDESQDFPESFFDLCSKVTRKCVYIAGDIFQNIFDSTDVSKVEPQFLLNKCYRTDPKTLMCAHAIGMGLFETNGKLRWLEDRAWIDCGYDIRKRNGFYDLYRKPLRRFEDLGNFNISNIEIMPTKRENYFTQIMETIHRIRKENPSVEADDIGIMFLENVNINYTLANQLQVAINERFDWDVNIGYETKTKKKGALFISNRNNVKGLEFPFVICFMQTNLSADLQARNSIYMMLTRSFITSYFILPDTKSKNLDEIIEGVNEVNRNGYLHISEPSDKEKERLNNAIIRRTSMYKSQREIVDEILDELKIKKELREKFHGMISIMYKGETDREKLYEFILTNYNMMN